MLHCQVNMHKESCATVAGHGVQGKLCHIGIMFSIINVEIIQFLSECMAHFVMQVLTKLQNVCGWLRVSSHYQVGSLLIAVRAGPVPAGISGLVIAASAKAMPLALQAVKAAVRQIEALSMDDAAAQGSGVAF